ncbi:MAG: hypothetical protein IKL18_06550 [Oscillospiraceae bacterium]|nr:hypothetical protein [Oscillospiraceae bacterium]
MKNFLVFVFCGALIIGCAFGFSEYFYGTTGIMESGIINIGGVWVFEKPGKALLVEEPEEETEEKIIEILSKAERKNRRSTPTEPIEGLRTDYEIEIYFSDIYEHRFVYLGEKSNIYDPKSEKSWEIVNAEEIIQELDTLFAE